MWEPEESVLRVMCISSNLSAVVNCDPIVDGKLKVVYLENYRVSLAERGVMRLTKPYHTTPHYTKTHN